MTNILDGETVYLIANKHIQLFVPLDNGHQYVTTVRHDLSIAEVANSDVPELLNKRCGCCDDYYRCFRGIATPEEVELWKSPIID